MKNFKLLALFGLIISIISFSACTKTNVALEKSAKINLKAVTKPLGLKSTAAYTVTSATINIGNLIIEENSGNDGENVGDNTNDGNDNETSSETESSSTESDNGDISFVGPYVLDIASGSASIGSVDVYPGTFRKVDFDFITSEAVAFGGSSIVISGEYTAIDGTKIPFIINSAFSKTVQMPLAEAVSVAANASVTFNVVFDITSWLSAINFETAVVTNGEILIDSNTNADLLSSFDGSLASYVELED